MQYRVVNQAYATRKRQMTVTAPSKSCITEANIKSTMENLNPVNGEDVVRRICSNTLNANTYYEKVLDIMPVMESTMSSSDYDQLRKNVVNTLCMKIKPEYISKFDEAVRESKIDDTTKALIHEKVNEIKVYDRVLKNNERLSCRFNIEKVINSYGNSQTEIENCTTELCEMIDTYPLSMDAKLNIALENISYSMIIAGKANIDQDNINLSKYILEYYLGTNSVITDSTMDKVKSIVENNIFIDTNTRDIYTSILEKHSSLYKDQIEYLASSCDDPDNGKFIRNVLKIKNEKQASTYIDIALNRIAVYKMSKKDRKKIMQSISAIPLLGVVSGEFVQYELSMKKKYKKAKDAIDDAEFNKLMDDIFNDEIDNVEESIWESPFTEEFNMQLAAQTLNESVKNTYDLFGDNYLESVEAFLESETFADSDDIKDLINKFNADQDKSVGRFRNMISKIYKKSPKAIIDGLPNIFSLIRVVFILGTAAINPIVGIIVAFIDHLISMDINKKQAEQIIRAIDKEKSLVQKKIDKGGNNVDELKKYMNCLNTCLRKVEAFRDNITDDDIEGHTRASDDGFDDDLDFDLEECRDFFVYADSIDTILEAKTNGSEDKILSVIDSLLEEENIADTMMVFKRCPNLISFETIQEAYDNKYQGKELYSVVCESRKFYNSEYNTPVYEENNVLDDLLFERCVAEEVLPVITEGVNLSTLKLAMQNVKKKFKDMSTKEKQVCQTVDVHMDNFVKSMEKAMTSDRREAIIKGSMIPSFSKCMKSAMVVGGAAVVNPVVGMITALGMYGCSKKLNKRERQLIFDEIETELKVVDKQIQLAENDGDMNQYRFLLQYQKKLERERQRIKYGLKVNGRDIPSSSAGRKESY